MVTRSPTAEMVGTAVRHSGSTLTNPRVTVTPFSSYPRPAETGPRPTATSRTSASSCLPVPSVTWTPASV